jgi:hypothetical protein
VHPFLESFSGFHGASAALLVGALALLGTAGLAFGWRWTTTRPRLPRPGPATREPGPEPVAVASFLVHRCHVSSVSLPATILDLAARGWLGVEMYGPQTVIRVRERALPSDALLPHEADVMEHIRHHATGGSAPVEALRVGGEGAGFWKRFQQHVVAEARNEGLAANRFRAGDWTLFSVLLAGGLALLALALGETNLGRILNEEDPIDRFDWFIGAGALWFVIVGVGIARLRDVRETPAGREAASRWLGVRRGLAEDDTFEDLPPAAVTVWGRYFAAAAALGLAHEATDRLAILEDDPETAWSRESGHWRELRVRYPSRFAFGEPPGTVAWHGFVRTAVYGGILFVALPIIVPVGFDLLDTATEEGVDRRILLAIGGVLAVVAAILAGNLAVGLVYLVRGLLDLGPAVVEEGPVVKVHGNRFAIDPGEGDTVIAWRPGAASGPPARGQRVRVTRTRHLQYVRSVVPIGTAPPA